MKILNDSYRLYAETQVPSIKYLSPKGLPIFQIVFISACYLQADLPVESDSFTLKESLGWDLPNAEILLEGRVCERKARVRTPLQPMDLPQLYA